METLSFVSTIAAAVGSCLIAGIFFIFSTTIMRAFGRLPESDGIAAMNMINVVIINPMFLGVFLGTGFLCALLIVVSIVKWNEPGSAKLLAGSLLYIIGSIGVTMAFNVPLNNALAAVTPDNASSVWTDYLSTWTFWNHVRTIASLAASVSLIVSLTR